MASAELMVGCACGCATLLVPHDRQGRVRRFLQGHHTRISNPGFDVIHTLPKPKRGTAWRADGKHWRTARWRARELTPHDRCAWESIGDCKGVIDVAHVDGDFTNNDTSNCLPLCRSHHRLLDNGRINPSNPVMPPFYVDGSGKRRYSKSPYWDRPRRSRPAPGSED